MYFTSKTVVEKDKCLIDDAVTRNQLNSLIGEKLIPKKEMC